MYFLDLPLDALALFAFQLITCLPSRLAYLAASLALFDLRSKKTFVTLWLLSVVLSVFVLAIDSALIRTPLAILLLVGPQMALAKDALLRRSFICVIFVAILMLSDVAPGLLWMEIAGQTSFSPYALERYYEEIIFLRMFHALMVIVLLAGVIVAERKISKVHTEQGIIVFMGFLVVQCSMLSLTIFAVESMEHVIPGVAVVLLGSIAICIVADAMMMVCMMWFNQVAQEEQRSNLLQDEVDWYLSRYREIECEVVSAASLRHDANNQVNTIMMLLRQGDGKRAQMCLNELIAWMEDAPCVTESCLERAYGEVGHEKNDREIGSSEDSPNLAGDNYVGHWSKWDSSEGRWFGVRSHLVTIAKALFVASQVLLLIVLLAYVAWGDPNPLFVLSVIGVAVLCVLSDESLLAALGKASEKDLVRERTRLLEEQYFAQQIQSKRLWDERRQARQVRVELLARLHKMRDEVASDQIDDPEGWHLLMLGISAERYCQHAVVNALITLKAGVCQSRGIRFTHSLSIPADAGLSDLDLCAIFSNLLDNAINGCSGVEGGGWVSIKARLVAGSLVVDVENSCVEEASKSAMSPLVSMTREHGWGTRILEGFARRYEGSFETRYAGNGRWRASIMLLLPSVDGEPQSNQTLF